jgi:hypothetical protein
VVANGSYGYDLLRLNGIPERALARGSALQYNAPGGAAPAPDGGQAGRPVVRVLVALPILKTQSAELLLAALGAFADPRAFHVTIKFHPRFSASRVLREAGVASFPSHVRVVREPMPDLLRKADVLLYTYTASAVEALTAGVPIVHFVPACDIDLDPLAGFDDIRHSTGTMEGLREAVRAVVTAAPAEREARMRRGREIRDQFWQPPDEKTFEPFMPENVR